MSLHFDPFAFLRRLPDCFQNLLILQSILKSGLRRLTFGHCIHKIGNGMHKGVFIANNVPRRPPLAYIRMHPVLLSDNNISKALSIIGSCVVEKLKPHIF